MSDNIKLSGIFCVGAVLLAACMEKPKNQYTHFTKADSVTETYLNLKDKMFETWNLMMRDDNQKIRAMRNLVHELGVTNHSLHEDLEVYTTLQRLVETIRTADQRVNNYRIEYDRIAAEYNEFIDGNVESLREVENDSPVEKSPLFQMVAED